MDTSVRRETVSGYLKAARVAVRGRGGRPAQWPPSNPATTSAVSTDSVDTSLATVATAVSGPTLTLSVCAPYRDLIDPPYRAARRKAWKAIRVPQLPWAPLFESHARTFPRAAPPASAFPL